MGWFSRLRSAGVLDGMWTAAASAGGKLQALAVLGVAGATGGLPATGLVVLVMSTAILTVSVLDAGLTPQGTRLYANGRLDARGSMLAPFAWRAVLHVPVGIGMFALLVLITEHPESAAWWAVAQVAYAVTYHAAYSATGIAYGKFQFRRGATLNAAVRLTTVPLLIWAGLAGSPLYALLLILAVGEGTVAVLQYLLAARGESTDSARADLALARTWRYGVGPIANTLMNKSDTVIVAGVLTSAALGTYAVASQAENAVTTLAMIPAGALIVHVARSGRGDASHAKLAITVRVVAVTYAIGALPFFIAPERMVELIFRVSLTNALPLRICLVAGVFSVLGGVLMQQLTGLGEDRAIVRIWVSAAIVSVIAMLGLSVAWGAVGAAFGALARDLFFFAYSRYSLTRSSHSPVPAA